MINRVNRWHSHSYSWPIFTLAFVSGLAGCGGATQNGDSTAASKESATNGPSVVSAKPTPSSGTGTNASSTAGSDTTKPSPFHIVADVDYKFELQRVGKSGILVADGQLLPIRDNTVTFDPKFALSKEIRGDGIHGLFQFLLGEFPDNLFASVVRPSGRTGFNELYKWNGSKWASHYQTDETTFVLDIQPWQNGTLLMVEAHSFSGEYRFSVFPKSSKVFVPEPRERKWRHNTMCEFGFIPDALHTLPSGHVFMTGTVCATGDIPQQGQTGVKRWSPDDAKGTIDVLPEIGSNGFDLINLAVVNEKDAFVGGNTKSLRYGPPKSLTPYLAHFDGKSWTRDTLPFSDGMASMEVDANGKVWVISTTGAVFSRPAGGTWAEITLPAGGEGNAPISATTIWSRAPGDEWILGSYQAKGSAPRYIVLHSGARGEMAKLPDFETMENTVAELAMPTPLTWRCSTPFVLLFTLSKVAPPDFDYPATREALKGHTEFKEANFIEFKRLDKRYMGAFVPNAEMGKKLVELVKKKVPNSTPQLACHSPKPSRVLEFNLSR